MLDEPETPETDGATTRVFDRIWWGAMLALGWIIYEVTARPTWGIAVACAKFGWNDFLTAVWLMRVDPNPGRRRACFWFYLAAGFYRIAVGAILLALGIVILMMLFQQKAPRELTGAGWTALAGLTMMSILPLVGVLLGWMYGARVWVDASVHESRRIDLWPPEPTGKNMAMNLLTPALLVPIVITAFGVARVGVLLTAGFLMLEGVALWSVFRRVCAEYPEDCWNELTPPLLYTPVPELLDPDEDAELDDDASAPI